jgi:hypothetical protein
VNVSWRITEYFIYLLREVYWLVYGYYPSYTSYPTWEDVLLLLNDIETKIGISSLSDSNSINNPEVLRDRFLEIHLIITGVPFGDPLPIPEDLDNILESIISISPSVIPSP